MSGPWKSKIKDIYFPASDIDSSRWDKVFPYRLSVIDARNNKIITSSGTGIIDIKETTRGTQTQGNARDLNIKFREDKWEVRLPITPQQISISDEFAISNTPALRGILEEHNGIVYKSISMSGTTGIYPLKKQKDFKSIQQLGPMSKGLQQSLNSSVTKTQLASLASNPNSVVSKSIQKTDAQNKELKFKQKIYEESIDLSSTGYYHALIFGQFLEQYAIAKKDPKNAHWRLTIHLDKDNTAYFITPQSFTLSKSSSRPGEHIYSFKCLAWKRVSFTEESGDDKNLILMKSLDGFPKAANSFFDKLSSISSALSEARALRSNINSAVFDKIRKAVVGVKSITNGVFNIIDMPAQLINDAKYSIIDTISVANLIAMRAKSSAAKLKNVANFNILKQGVSEYSSFSAASKQQTTSKKKDALTSDRIYVKNGPLQSSMSIDPLLKLDPISDYQAIRDINVDDIDLTQHQRDLLEQDFEENSTVTVEQLQELSTEIRSLAQDLAIRKGVGNELAAYLSGKPKPKERPYPLSLEENELLIAMFDFIQSIDEITQNRALNSMNIQSPMKFTIDVLNENGINLTESESKILVPVPFDRSIEEIALKYLGDRNRWPEIVALNELREPYIDEIGIKYNILSNGDGSIFTVGSKEDLFVGQKIGLASNLVPIFYRTVSSIEKLSETSYLIEVDGERNLDRLKLSDSAYVHFYKPGTVNSQDLIFIPSDTPVSPQDYPTITQGIVQNSMNQLSKVDFLLTDDFDIAINDSGDFRMASGLTNLIQALKIKLSTERGTLLNHPDFGLSASTGTSTADFTATQIFAEIRDLILSDKRFSSLKSMKVTQNGPTLDISLQVELPNNLGIVPINFTIPKS